MSKAKAKLLRSIVSECNPLIDAFLQKIGPMLKAEIAALAPSQRIHDLYDCFRNIQLMSAAVNSILDKCPAEISEFQTLHNFEDFLMKLEREERGMNDWENLLPVTKWLSAEAVTLEEQVDQWAKEGVIVQPVQTADPDEPPFEEAVNDASTEGITGDPSELELTRK